MSPAHRFARLVLPALLLGAPATATAGEFDQALAPILELGEEGRGNDAATLAWQQLRGGGTDALLPALAALDKANPVAANWLRTAVDAIVEDQLRAGRPLPTRQLEAFVKDAGHAPRGRRLAFDILARAEPAARDRLLAGMLDDPSVELRRDAVARAIEQAQPLVGSAPEKAKTEFLRIFDATRDKDQVEAVAKTLEGLGTEVDIVAHLNYVTDWTLVGPFDNTDGAGYAKAYPPEEGIDLAASYAGKEGKPVTWKPFTTEEDYGDVDLNKAIGKHMGACAYAYSVVESPEERPVEVRVSSNNAVKLFLNGKQLFAVEEYHHGKRIDQYVGKAVLKKGRNTLLLKVCQNEQKDSWAQSWSFQLRVCDATGGKVPMTVVTK